MQPSAPSLVCPRCAASVPPGAQFCARCGSRVGSTGRGPGFLQILGALALLLVAVPLGLIGACGAMILPFSLVGGGGGSGFLVGGGLALAGIGGAVLCIVGVIRLLR